MGEGVWEVQAFSTPSAAFPYLSLPPLLEASHHLSRLDPKMTGLILTKMRAIRQL